MKRPLPQSFFYRIFLANHSVFFHNEFMPTSNPSGSSLGGRTSAGLAVFCLLAAVIPLAWLGPAIIDDAYITFRYAENLAAGKGFVFNETDGPIQGTSTPLFTLLLALARFSGLSCPRAALAIGVVGAAAALFFGAMLFRNAGGRQQGWPWSAMGWVLVMASLPEWIFALQSGMETMLFVGLATGAILATTTPRPTAAGLLAGLAVLTRYDGWALAVIVLGWSLYAHRRKAWLGISLFLALQIPWILYALATFGSYLPQSVDAKRLIHARSFTAGLAAHLHYFIGDLRGMTGSAPHRYLTLWFLAGAALVLIRRSRPGCLLLLWAGASILGFSLARILLQGWYLIPSLVVYAWVAVWGLWEFSDMWSRRLRSRPSNRRTPLSAAVAGGMRWGLPSVVILFLFAANVAMLWPEHDRWPLLRTVRERAYFEAAAWLRREGRPGRRVLVGEVGVLGWALPGFEVIDSAGINSQRLYEIRRDDVRRAEEMGKKIDFPQAGTVQWVRRALSEMKPDYIVSIESFLWLQVLRHDAAFLENYEEAEVIVTHPAYPVWIFRRKNPGK